MVSYKKNSDAVMAFKYLQQKSTGEDYKIVDWIPLEVDKKDETISGSSKTFFWKNNNNQENLSCSKGVNKVSVSVEKFQFKNDFYKRENINNDGVIKQFSNYLERENSTPYSFCQGKLIVRNIPFKIEINDLKKIFSIFGKILSIRLPKRKNGENRGFAFINYGNINDAKKALYFVQNTKIDSRFLKINIID